MGVLSRGGLVSRRGAAAMAGAIALAAWITLAVGAGGIAAVPICTPSLLRAASASLSLALMVNSPARLLAGWMLMVAATMTPLTLAPLSYLRQSSLARLRGRATLLFCAGYAIVWLAAGVCLETLALSAWIAAPRSFAPLTAAALVAIVWQVSPFKQICLNGCHRRPTLAAFGVKAARDAVTFGLTQGAWCVGGCWALMLTPLMLREGHLIAMAGVALFVLLERLERPSTPAWRWRFPGLPLRVVAARATPLLASFASARRIRTVTRRIQAPQGPRFEPSPPPTGR